MVIIAGNTDFAKARTSWTGSNVDQRKYESPKFDEINTKIYIYKYSWFAFMVFGTCKWFRVQISILSRWVNFENSGDETLPPISGDEN